MADNTVRLRTRKSGRMEQRKGTGFTSDEKQDGGQRELVIDDGKFKY
jgi:hypothetical protein